MPRFPGWVDSGAEFREERFEFLWGRVAKVICEAATRVESAEPTPADAVAGPRAG